MRGAVLIVLLLVSTLNVRVVIAQVVKDIPAGEDKIVPLRRGEPAPLDGQLFDSPTALRWSNWLIQLKTQLDLEVEYRKKVFAVDEKYFTDKLELETTKYSLVVGSYQTDIAALKNKITVLQDKVDNPSFLKSPLLWFITGVMATGAVVALTAYAVHK